MLSEGSVAVATRRAVSRRPPERRDAAELLRRHSKRDRGGGGFHGGLHPASTLLSKLRPGILFKKKNVLKGPISTASSPAAG